MRSPDVPRKGNVDRNNALHELLCMQARDVPRKGNVDRNGAVSRWRCVLTDVPRKGNVDRNVRANAPSKEEVRRSPQGERG